MKVFGIALSFVAVVSAGVPRPEILVGINVGEEQKGSLGGIEPRVKWATSGEVAGFDVEGGIDITIKDVDQPPITGVWGKFKRSIEGFGDIAVRGDMDPNTPDNVNLDIRANAFGTAIQVVGQAGSDSVSVDRVQVTKDLDAFGGKFSFTPKYDVGAQEGDLRVGYAMDGTKVIVDAQSKKLTVAHSFTDKDTVAPTLTAAGDLSLSYSRDLDVGRITTTWTPNDSIKLHWSDGVYDTTIKAPLEGMYKTTSGVRVNIKRSVGII